MAAQSVQQIGHIADNRQLSLLQVLLAVQDANPSNYVSEEDIQQISATMGVSRCRVYSTASFYDEISLEPRGVNIIRVCANAPCENAGRQAILDALRNCLRVEIGETTENKLFTLESVNCLGACYMSPAIKINDKIYGDLSPSDIPGILAQYSGGGRD